MATELEKLQEKLAEGTDEEEDLGDNAPVDMGEFPEGAEPEKPSAADVIAAKAAMAAGRTGEAARRLLESVGSKIEAPSPPGDDLSDLFEGPDMERDNDVYIKDLVTVEEEDVFGEGGEDMSDILEVTEEDVMGEEDPIGEEVPVVARPPSRPARHVPQRAAPPTGIAGLQT